MVDFEEIEYMFATDKKIQSISLVDYEGNALVNKTRTEQLSVLDVTKQADLIDLRIIKHILDLTNHSHGKPISLQIKRENIQQSVYYLENYIIYVTKSETKENGAKIFDKLEEVH